MASHIAPMASSGGKAVRVLLAVVITSAPLAARAQEPAPRDGDRVGTHVVSAGETLQVVTQRYLGTPHLWEENWRLNPGVADPHRLWPGQQLRVILERRLPRREAALTRVVRHVEKKPDPQLWTRAAVGDRLLERDGLRTYEEAAAELLFDDGFRLELGEESIVFLREFQARLRGLPRQSIELVQGQADLAVQRRPARGSDVEILMAAARARPDAADTGSLHARARLSGAGTAQVMVFDGGSAVEAAGESVHVPKGMGTSVPKGATPRPPEALLPAPEPRAPAPNSVRGHANPLFTWSAVRNASGYVVEVFADAAGQQVLAREAVSRATQWAPQRLPRGPLYWRVAAVSASGLDGYASSLIPFTITDARPDQEPPVVQVAFQGPGLALDRGRIALAPAGRVLLVVKDDLAGVETVRYRWDGRPWRAYDGQPLAPPRSGSVLEVRAVDHRGRESAPWTAVVEIHRDLR